MNKRQWILGAVHVALWIATVLAVESAMEDSASRAAYAVLCAWWATLYVGLLVGSSWRAVPVFLVGMIAALAIDGSIGWKHLYHDTPDVASAGFLWVSVISCVLWSSPFVVNEIARRVRDRIAK
ncbi:MAG TPA: hypothetical protein VE046_14195 [Steroidobacteraceae bacterium]|nr:hypothetical protein [Steroidobacteraceae bacterium]